MSIITSISIRNEDWAYLREKHLSPTALFNIGLARTKNRETNPEEFKVDSDDFEELKHKLEGALGAIKILTERAERAEAQYRAERAYRIGKTEA